MKRIIRFFLRVGYRYILKPIFFRFDPENVHDVITAVGVGMGKHKSTRLLLKKTCTYEHPMLEQEIAGLVCKNPVGLAGGFDKNAQLVEVLPSVGFGFMEVGSITAKPCEGNPKPRLWRLPKTKALGVYYGLKNDGATAIAKRLVGRTFDIPLGINIAKTNCKETVDPERGVADYVFSYKTFVEKNIGDYFTINISCPNAYGGQPFTDPQLLDELLKKIVAVSTKKPLFLKVSPDISNDNAKEIVRLVDQYNLTGFICSNLTKKRNKKLLKDTNVPEKGGISGKTVSSLSNTLVSYLYEKTRGEKIIIGTGGVFTGGDAYEKIIRGASLVQLVTGLVFQGPQAIADINAQLVRCLKRDGFTNIDQAIGALHK